ncbi:hypothetical protein [Simplicispira piscis]
MGPIPRSALGLALAFAFASPAFAGNYAECIIDKMPGVANDTAATAVYQMCKSEYPGTINSVPQGSGRGMFSFKSGAECTAKKAGDTRSNQAAHMIGVACRKLYDEADWWKKNATPIN